MHPLSPGHEPITARYINVTSGGLDYRIFYEEAGEGVPLICLHTAGTDSRQFRHVLNDPEVTAKCRVIAFDMPYHGRSNPPENWWLNKYQLSSYTSVFHIAAHRRLPEPDPRLLAGAGHRAPHRDGLLDGRRGNAWRCCPLSGRDHRYYRP